MKRANPRACAVQYPSSKVPKRPPQARNQQRGAGAALPPAHTRGTAPERSEATARQGPRFSLAKNLPLPSGGLCAGPPQTRNGWPPRGKGTLRWGKWRLGQQPLGLRRHTIWRKMIHHTRPLRRLDASSKGCIEGLRTWPRVSSADTSDSHLATPATSTNLSARRGRGLAKQCNI